MDNDTKLEKFVKKINPEYEEFINIIAQTQNDFSLVCFLGAGTSMAQGYKNWDGYVQDLIQYWKSHLQDLIKQTSFYQVVNAKDINFLDWLNDKSGFDNKRKVDIVHYIIKKYCKPQLTDDQQWDQIYRSHENDFEKYYFLNIAPVNAKNEIIDQIINLSGIFITSNYDDQIEKSFQKFYNSTPNVLNDATELGTRRLSNKSVLHLHGTPVIPGVLLVSSSTSYNQLYFNGNNFKEKLKEQLKKQGSKVLLFVGSSLQEEEILNLFNFSNFDIKQYALMKYRNDFGPGQADIVKEYYKINKGVNIIWYGKEYNKLPVFLGLMNRDVNEKIKKENTFISTSTITKDLQQKDYSKLNDHITRALRNKEDIDICFKKNLDNESIKVLIDNPTFRLRLLSGDRFNIFWKEIDKKYKTLSKTTISKIIKILENMTDYPNGYNLVDILYKNSKKLPSNEKLNYLYKSCFKFLYRADMPYMLPNNYERNLWLLINLSNRNIGYSLNTTLLFENNKNIKFKMSSSELKLLIKIINENKFDQIANIENLLEDERWQTLFLLISENRLQYANKECFPNYFYKNKLIQRIFINLALQNRLPNKILCKVKDNIDFNDRLLGKEMNEFVKKFCPSLHKANDFYIDGWYMSDFKEVENKPFFRVTPPNSSDSVKKLITNLKRTVSLNPTTDDRNLEGQQEELINVLNNKKSWKYFHEYIILFLSDAINDKNIFLDYQYSINKILMEGIKQKYINSKLIELYIRTLFKDQSNALSLNNREILDFITDLDDAQIKSILYDVLLDEVNPKKIKFYLDEDLSNKKWIQSREFFSSEAYEYYKLIEKLTQNNIDNLDKKHKANFLNGINSLNKKEREYIKGRFFTLFDKMNDLELKTENAFVGFSTKYYVNKKISKFFKSQIIKLINSDFNDTYCEHNIIFAMLYSIKPDEVKIIYPIQAISYKKILIDVMLRNFVKDKLMPENNTIEWCDWYLKNEKEFPQQLLNVILQNIDNYKNDKLLFDLLINSPTRIEKYSLHFTNVYFIKRKAYSEESFILLISMIDILFKKQLLNIHYSMVTTIDIILAELKERKLDKLIVKLLEVSRKFLPVDEQRNLEDKYAFFR